MLDHPAGAHPLDMVALRLGHQLIDAVAEKASLTDAVGADQIRGRDVALRQPPGELEGGSGSLDVSRDDAVPEHVDEGDDVLFDAGIQKAGQLRVGPQCGDVTVDQFADIGDQPGDPRFQAGCDRGDLLPESRIGDLHRLIVGGAGVHANGHRTVIGMTTGACGPGCGRRVAPNRCAEATKGTGNFIVRTRCPVPPQPLAWAQRRREQRASY